jgi:peptidyl-prolyl cis-trans isomerase D
MLKVFRDNLKNLAWVLWVVIAVFVITLAADFGSGGMGDGGGQPVAATVGDETVSMEEFQRNYQQLAGLYRQVYGEQLTPELEKQMRLPMQALERAVNQKILLAEARRLGLRVSDEELRQRILQEDVFKDEQGNFVGEQSYAEILQQNRLTPSTFESGLREELLLQKLSDALRANLYVSDDEIQRAYREQVERAKIRYIQLPRDRFAAQVQVQPNELAAYFQAHQQEFRTPEQREAAYVLVDAAKLAGQAPVTDADLRSWYDANKQTFTQEAQVRARHILVMVNDQRTDEAARQRIGEAKRRLEGGADFAAVSTEFSDDAASKANGGDLGFFGAGRMVPEFDQAAFSAQPGKLVGPVKTSFGYHLLEVTDKRPGGTRSFEEVKETIRARLAGERTQELAESRAKELAAKLTEDKPKNAEALRAATQGNPALTFGETGKVGAQDPIPNLGFNPAINSTAFTLKKGEVSQAVRVPQGWAVIYLKEIHAPRVPDLKEVEDRVRAAAGRDKQQRLAVQRLEAIRRELAQGKTLDQAAAELGVEVKTTEEFGSQGAIPGLGSNPELAKAALASKVGQVGGPVADAQGALLFQVTERKGWDPKQFATNKEQTRQTLLQQRLSNLQSALVAERRRELGVEYDRQLLQEIGMTPPQEG